MIPSQVSGPRYRVTFLSWLPRIRLRHSLTLFLPVFLICGFWFYFHLGQSDGSPVLLAPPSQPQAEPETSTALTIVPDSVRRANATFYVLCRNEDLPAVLSSMKQVEERFNWRYGYPWTFLNENDFTDEFKRATTAATNYSVEYGKIPDENWYQPDWIDEDKASAGRQRLSDEHIIYADSVPYRNMCRFNSGFYFNHPLMQKYKYAWRVDSDAQYYCYIDHDPFIFMEQNNKIYGFVIALPDFEQTIPSLWGYVREFMQEYPQYITPEPGMGFLSDDNGITYNLCHFWSNFEIVDMDFFRSEAYQAFFNFLDRKGGFYYERWGDAPIHSLAVTLLAPKSQIHFFREIGYRHEPATHCPRRNKKSKDGGDWGRGRCECNYRKTFDYQPQSCLPRYIVEYENGVFF